MQESMHMTFLDANAQHLLVVMEHVPASVHGGAVGISRKTAPLGGQGPLWFCLCFHCYYNHSSATLLRFDTKEFKCGADFKMPLNWPIGATSVPGSPTIPLLNLLVPLYSPNLLRL